MTTKTSITDLIRLPSAFTAAAVGIAGIGVTTDSAGCP
jgi:hypothetical protein